MLFIFKMSAFGDVPPDLKGIQHYLKIAAEHDTRNPIISYWCRFYAIQAGLKVGSKSKESSSFLFSVMDWLEKEKKKHPDEEAISNDVVAQATIENYALKLFNWADGEDRSCRWNKNVVKAFYTAGFIYDIVDIFGEPSEEVAHHRKYAKWKSTYIHNCLKNGTTPIPGPVAMEGEDEENNLQAGESDRDNNLSGLSANPGFISTLGPAGVMPTPYPTFPPGAVPEAGLYAPPSTPNGSSEPSPAAPEITYVPPQTADGVSLTPEHFHKAQKFCKWAGSALQYEDVPTAIENLQKALALLTTGKCD